MMIMMTIGGYNKKIKETKNITAQFVSSHPKTYTKLATYR